MARIELPSGRISLQQLPQIGRGARRDVVMIHGLGANLGFWYASAVQWFRRFGRVTLLDLPGHGDSEMPESGYTPDRLARVVRELLDCFEIDRAHLIAHSFGGTVALAFAAACPDRVASLVLADVRLWSVEPPIPATTDGPIDLYDDTIPAGFYGRPLDPSVQLLVDIARSRLETEESRHQAPDCSAMPGARALFPGRRSARRWLRLIETTQAYDEMTDPAGLSIEAISGLNQPMLALFGELSARKRSALALQTICPQCQLHFIPTVGHFFPLMRPRLFARPALAFLRTIARREATARRPARRPVAEAALHATESVMDCPSTGHGSASGLAADSALGELPSAAYRLS